MRAQGLGDDVADRLRPPIRYAVADSLRLAETMQKQISDPRVIAMDLLPAHEEIVELVSAGVSGFILKDAALE
jgi:DNA-binding NarL/FixJ family response regulator